MWFSFLLCWTRKAALSNSPVDCCNRRGFSAEKRVQQGISDNLYPVDTCWHQFKNWCLQLSFPFAEKGKDASRVQQGHLRSKPSQHGVLVGQIVTVLTGNIYSLNNSYKSVTILLSSRDKYLLGGQWCFSSIATLTIILIVALSGRSWASSAVSAANFSGGPKRTTFFYWLKKTTSPAGGSKKL